MRVHLSLSFVITAKEQIGKTFEMVAYPSSTGRSVAATIISAVSTVTAIATVSAISAVTTTLATAVASSVAAAISAASTTLAASAAGTAASALLGVELEVDVQDALLPVYALRVEHAILLRSISRN